ncbi:ThiF family adenylyltransferase [Streptomyces sp. RKAG293]|uniref:HesA/MoeB/ThiF family protein n=1 Tax=Streptomyces sp. RKAG293 TaxID=2893403 RepID=UPI002033E210|nr:ThiF family adenylyltransferase [Streptomyces sp. RKAG293]MCM2420611.1 ThiF family adenylyltransferase [Streptomyces sp. RKAG293]
MKNPMVKEEHLPYRHEDGTVRIGGELYGLAAAIRDPHGWIWASLTLMDGRHTEPEIAELLRLQYPALTPETAAGLVAQLIATGYCEDAAARIPEELSAHEMAKYSRNQAFFRRVGLNQEQGPWDAHIALSRSRVLILGLGGTGSHAAWSLAAAGVGHIHCVDGDTVELSNLTRQALYTEADLDRAKAEVAAEKLRGVNSAAEVTFDLGRVETQEQLAHLLAGYDVLALCADEPDSETIRGWASAACAEARIPWVGGGYNGPLVTVGVFGPDGPCFQCLAAGEEALIPPGSTPPHLGGPGVIAPSAAISGHLVAYETIALLTGISRNPPGYVRGLNLISPDDHVHVRHPALPECGNCNA